MSRSRVAILAVGLTGLMVIGSGCAVITVSGSGTDQVTISSDQPSTSNTVAYLCRGASGTCAPTDPYEYIYRPPDSTEAVTVSAGFAVEDRSGDPVALPAGRYSVGIFGSIFGNATEQDTVIIDLAGSQERDLSIWHQASGRGDDSAPCPDDWQPSWAQWPNDGTGGFVCNHQSYAYYPDIPVPTGEPPSVLWHQSIARLSADEQCPSGYQPGWAQWPNEGSGGFTCTRDLR